MGGGKTNPILPITATILGGIAGGPPGAAAAAALFSGVEAARRGESTEAALTRAGISGALAGTTAYGASEVGDTTWGKELKELLKSKLELGTSPEPALFSPKEETKRGVLPGPEGMNLNEVDLGPPQTRGLPSQQGLGILTPEKPVSTSEIIPPYQLSPLPHDVVDWIRAKAMGEFVIRPEEPPEIDWIDWSAEYEPRPEKPVIKSLPVNTPSYPSNVPGLYDTATGKPIAVSRTLEEAVRYAGLEGRTPDPLVPQVQQPPPSPPSKTNGADSGGGEEKTKKGKGWSDAQNAVVLAMLGSTISGTIAPKQQDLRPSPTIPVGGGSSPSSTTIKHLQEWQALNNSRRKQQLQLGKFV